MKGSIIERRGARGVAYMLKYDAGPDPVTGKRRQRYETVKGGKCEAEARLRELLGTVDKGTHVDPSRITFGDFLDTWFRDYAATNRAAKTNERDQEIVKLHIKPKLAKIRLQRLTRADLTGLYAHLQRAKAEGGAGLAARTVGHAHRIIHAALAYAVDHGLIAQNTATRVKKPRIVKSDVMIIPEDRIEPLLSALRKRPVFLPAVLALTTGLRRGELLALRWNEFALDVSPPTVRVDEALEETKAGMRFKVPKTNSSLRTLALAPSIVPLLRAHREQQLRVRAGLDGDALAGNVAPLDRLPGSTLVFGTFDHATGEWAPRRPSSLTQAWVKAAAAVGMPEITLHALRHTHASQLISAGYDVVNVGKRLGHASPSLTLQVFAHLFRCKDEEAAAIADRVLASVAGTAAQ